MMEHNFGEKKKEKISGNEVDVIQTEKYLSSKKKAIEMIESGKYNLTDADFWILMNTTKNKDYMLYSGLIISHNGCLKINDSLEENMRFNEEFCSDIQEDGYGYHMTYRDKRDGLLEYGEISKENCKNAYPLAMLLKRTFDRVVLKKSKLAYYGVYSDSEAEEFKEPADKKLSDKVDEFLWLYTQDEIRKICEHYNCKNAFELHEDILNKYIEDRHEK